MDPPFKRCLVLVNRLLVMLAINSKFRGELMIARDSMSVLLYMHCCEYT